jgi:hypothetical protein
MPNNNVELEGTWTFTPHGSHTVSYSVTGPAPSAFTPEIPADAQHQYTAIVTVAQVLTTTENTNAAGRLGTWTFSGWSAVIGDQTVTSGTFEMPGSNVVFNGTWTFVENNEHEVRYEVTGPAPASFTPAIPDPENVQQGATVIVGPLTTTENSHDGVLGVWTFEGWTIDGEPVGATFIMPNHDVEIKGTWSFTAHGSHTVSYNVTGTAPATFAPAIPADAQHQYTATVPVAAALTTTATTNAAGRLGTWTFSGWATTTEGVTVTAGEFTMPNTDVVFTGTWTFTPRNGDDDPNGGGGVGGGGLPATDDDDDDEEEYEDPDVPLGPFIEDHIWYVRGFPDGEFKPENSITRAEIAMILWRLIDSDAKHSPQAATFNDVPTGNWYAQAINYLASRDIVFGYEDGTFRPNNPITRAELTAVMSRFFDLDENGIADFSDVDSTHWAVLYINNAHNRGWILGFPDGTFRPNNSTTRAEAVTLINRVLERVPNPVTINYQLENHLYDMIGVERLFTDITNTHWAFYQIMEAAIQHEFNTDEGLEVWIEMYIPWWSNPANI